MTDEVTQTYVEQGDWNGAYHALRAQMLAAEAPLRAEIARLREALESIADGMIFPNQLESGFVHGKPTFADMRVRVDFAGYAARAALAQETGDV